MNIHEISNKLAGNSIVDFKPKNLRKFCHESPGAISDKTKIPMYYYISNTWKDNIGEFIRGKFKNLESFDLLQIEDRNWATTNSDEFIKKTQSSILLKNYFHTGKLVFRVMGNIMPGVKIYEGGIGQSYEKEEILSEFDKSRCQIALIFEDTWVCKEEDTEAINIKKYIDNKPDFSEIYRFITPTYPKLRLIYYFPKHLAMKKELGYSEFYYSQIGRNN